MRRRTISRNLVRRAERSQISGRTPPRSNPLVTGRTPQRNEITRKVPESIE